MGYPKQLWAVLEKKRPAVRKSTSKLLCCSLKDGIWYNLETNTFGDITDAMRLLSEVNGTMDVIREAVYMRSNPCVYSYSDSDGQTYVARIISDHVIVDYPGARQILGGKAPELNMSMLMSFAHLYEFLQIAPDTIDPSHMGRWVEFWTKMENALANK